MLQEGLLVLERPLKCAPRLKALDQGLGSAGTATGEEDRPFHRLGDYLGVQRWAPERVWKNKLPSADGSGAPNHQQKRDAFP